MPYIDPSVVERVKRIDLLTYLQEREPHELVRVSSTVYSTREHDSLKISNGKWYWWSQGIGGRSALDFLIKVRGMSFVDAVTHLDNSAITAAPITPLPTSKQTKHREQKKFKLPPANADVSAMRYLKSRGISQSVLDECFERGLVSGTFRRKRPYAVFVGNDENGSARYAALRACEGDFKGEVEGSDKRYSFRLVPEVFSKLHVCESAIDALSLATIYEIGGTDWRSLAFMSLGGVAPSRTDDGGIPEPLELFLSTNPNVTEVSLHLDNDDAGRRMAAQIKKALYERVDVVVASPPMGKDLNEYLMIAYDRKRKGRER